MEWILMRRPWASPAVDAAINNARGSFGNNKVFYNTPSGADSIDLDPTKLTAEQRLVIFEANYAQYGPLATTGIGYEDFKNQEWTAAGMKVVIQQMLLAHPKDGPQLLQEAKKAQLSFGVDNDDLVLRRYRLDSESRTILIKATGVGWGDRSVGDAAERLYEALKEYTTPGFLSRLLNGAGVAFARSGTLDLNNPEDWKVFEEWDANNRLGINDIAGRVRREGEDQVAIRAAGPIIGVVAGRLIKGGSQLLTRVANFQTVQMPKGRGAWQQALEALGFRHGGGESIVYIVRDRLTGEILKVGETGNVFSRFGEYMTRATREGIEIEIDMARIVNSSGQNASRSARIAIESDLRRGLSGQGRRLRWDKSKYGWAPGTGPNSPPTQWSIQP